MGHGEGRRLEGSALLAPARRRVAGIYALRRAAADGAATDAGLPRELLRSQRFCAMVRKASADGGGVGSCGSRIADHGEFFGRRHAASCGSGRGAGEGPGTDVWGWV